jgi:hypothetical protein
MNAKKNILTSRFVFVILIIAILTNGVNAEVLYINSFNGNDANPGTKERPVRTIAKAATIDNGSYGFYSPIYRFNWYV